MIEIRIGTSNRNIDTIDETWINEQISRRRAEDEEVCIEVVLNTEHLNLGLSSPTCSRAGGGRRPPNDHEREIIDLWNKHRLNTENYTGRDLVAFIQQLKKLT